VKAPAVIPCPCGRQRLGKALAFDACCGPALAGTPAPDAESLMRSRYTAFVRGDAAYLLATWHPDHRPASLELDADIRWLGLEVRACRATGPDAALVEFVARSRQGGRGHRLHERSRFLRQDGRWYYLDGDIL